MTRLISSRARLAAQLDGLTDAQKAAVSGANAARVWRLDR